MRAAPAHLVVPLDVTGVVDAGDGTKAVVEVVDDLVASTWGTGRILLAVPAAIEIQRALRRFARSDRNDHRAQRRVPIEVVRCESREEAVSLAVRRCGRDSIVVFAASPRDRPSTGVVLKRGVQVVGPGVRTLLSVVGDLCAVGDRPEHETRLCRPVKDGSIKLAREHDRHAERDPIW